MLGRLLDAIRGGHRRREQTAGRTPDDARTRACEPHAPELPFEVRPLEPVDRPQLPALFRASIEGLAYPDHDPEQLRDWAAQADREDFATQFDAGVTVVARAFGKPVAFAQLAPLDYLNMLYVHPDSAGEGMATLLVQYLEDEARMNGVDTIATHASPTARPFLAGAGFAEITTETVTRGPSELKCFRMEKRLRQ